MAGGVGERLWPASTRAHPKQFFLLNEELSFFQSSLLRALVLEVPGKIVVITRHDIHEACIEQCKKLYNSIRNESIRKKIKDDIIILCEKDGRHTAAALMTAVCYIKKVSCVNNPIILAMSSDHIIENTVAFARDCQIASIAAEQEKLVSFGIKPTFPCTEYGYIKMEQNSIVAKDVYKVKNFVQKPDLENAKIFFNDTSYLWNSGILCFSINLFLQEVLHYVPVLFHSFKDVMRSSVPSCSLIDGVKVIEHWDALEKAYDIVPSLDVDKVISERCKRSVTVTAHFSWKDIGNWDSYSEKPIYDESGKVYTADAHNNLVYADMPVMLCGVEDLIIIQKDGKLLVMQKGKSSLMKTALESMHEKQSKDLLGGSESQDDDSNMFQSAG